MTDGSIAGIGHHRLAVIGAGFSGLSVAVRLKEAGYDDFVLLERDSDIGGTWQANTYPGCACDVPSHLYSLSFAPNPDWSRAYSPQPEIHAYLQRTATERGVSPHVRLNFDVARAQWDDDAQLWRLTSTTGDEVTADMLVTGPGALSNPSLPAIPGIESFAGPAFHTARWDHDVDLAGKRVGVVGTGASSIQVVPAIAPSVGHLDLFQRTPAWIRPRNDKPISATRRRLYRHLPLTRKLHRWWLYWTWEIAAPFFTRWPHVLDLASKVALKHLNEQVPDPELRRKLRPRYTMGCKRILLSDDYYPALTRPNVDVVTDGIAEIRPHAVVTADGAEHPLDVLIFGTGFHVTDMPLADAIIGRGGRSLADVWRGGMSAYLGTTVAGFPNMFFMTGPNTGLGHSSMLLMIESQSNYLLDALRFLDRRGGGVVDVRADVQGRFNDWVQHRMRRTVWTRGGCQSWYLDPHGRNTTLWPASTWDFRRRTRKFDAAAYDVRPLTRRRIPVNPDASGVRKPAALVGD